MSVSPIKPATTTSADSTSGSPDRPAIPVEWRPIETIVPSPANVRIHPVRQVQALAASIRQFGWTVPLLIDDCGELIAGHGRLLAAQLIHETHVPCIVATALTPELARAYRLADNRIALMSGWDRARLRSEVEQAQLTLGFAIPGFAHKPARGGDRTNLTLSENSKRIAEHALIVECASEADQKRLYDRLSKEGYKCKPIT